VAGVLAQTELAPAQREMVDLIVASGRTLERVVSDVLDFSKIEAGRLEIEARPFDLRDELDGLLEMFRLRAEEKGLAFPVDYGPDVCGEFLGDVVRIKQVLGNLLSNAIKFTTEGEVRTRVEIAGGEGEPAIVTLEVQDSGIGFDDEVARRLFERFSQADGSITRRFGGTGLGLSISQALVEMMDGRISVVSAPGQGSRFTVTLPLPRGRPCSWCGPQAEAASAAPAPVEDFAEIKVLLAEDHAINRRVIELILGPLGVEMTIVENGAAAVEAYAEGAFDLVLMDMQMPVMDGLAATRAIRAYERARPGRPRAAIIMLSANAMRQHSEDAAAAGADLHLPKPVTAASLLEAVSCVLAVGDSAV
jgi:CheY-like chemotaxis protein